MMLPCEHCGAEYDLSSDEREDGSYSPWCTECLRRAAEANEPLPPERPLAEFN